MVKIAWTYVTILKSFSPKKWRKMEIVTKITALYIGIKTIVTFVCRKKRHFLPKIGKNHRKK
jgi:hypothetical protein